MSSSNYVILLAAVVCASVNVSAASGDLRNQPVSINNMRQHKMASVTGGTSRQEDFSAPGPVFHTMMGLIGDFCRKVGSTACRELDELNRRIGILQLRADERQFLVLQGIAAQNTVMALPSLGNESGDLVLAESKRGRPALSVDAPMRQMSENVHRHNVRMSMELLRRLGRKRR